MPWSRMKHASVSSYCSRNRASTMASRKVRVPRFSRYQLGRGRDPVMVVARARLAVAVNIALPLYGNRLQNLRAASPGCQCPGGPAHHEGERLSLIHISEPTRLLSISYA